MISAIGQVVYFLGVALTWRKVAGLFVEWDKHERPSLWRSGESNGEAYIFGGFFAFFAAWAWPLLVPGWYVYRFFNETGHPAVGKRLLFAPPKRGRSSRERIEQLEQERDERRRYIRSLEHELGVGEDRERAPW